MHEDKDQGFLQFDFSTLGIKVSLQGDTIIDRHVVKVLSLQYLKKEVEDGVHFLYADKHQSFYKAALLILMEVSRHVQVPKIGSC